MKELSKIALKVNPSTTLAIDSLAKQMKADGLDVIGFGTGEPDFMTPDNISEAGIAAIREGKTSTPRRRHRPAAQGRCRAPQGRLRPRLRLYADSYSLRAKHNVYAALRALVNPGDEVIVPRALLGQLLRDGQHLRRRARRGRDHRGRGLQDDPAQLEAAVTPKTKALMLNNPSNPTGMVYTESELRALAKVCVKHDLYVIADEIYISSCTTGSPSPASPPSART